MPEPHPAPVRLKIIGLVIIVLGLAADLGSKAFFEDYLGMDPGHQRAARRVEVIEGFFAWEGVYNPGVTFGLAAEKTEWILLLTALATIGLIFWFLKTRVPSKAIHVGLALIIAGALGNLYDRQRWAKVRDFILLYVGDAKWPNFNVADMCIVCGVTLVMWDALFGYSAKLHKAEMERKKAKKGAPTGTPGEVHEA